MMHTRSSACFMVHMKQGQIQQSVEVILKQINDFFHIFSIINMCT